jgi:heat-inducible transcriptional repressor
VQRSVNILVREYIHTAAPVGSEDIARLSPTKVSPATVRNTMSQLNEEGYISRPHASAGGYLRTAAIATTWSR